MKVNCRAVSNIIRWGSLLNMRGSSELKYALKDAISIVKILLLLLIAPCDLIKLIIDIPSPLLSISERNYITLNILVQLVDLLVNLIILLSQCFFLNLCPCYHLFKLLLFFKQFFFSLRYLALLLSGCILDLLNLDPDPINLPLQALVDLLQFFAFFLNLEQLGAPDFYEVVSRGHLLWVLIILIPCNELAITSPADLAWWLLN